jgi:hypothetical protein
MRTYHQRYRFRHPRTEDFIQVVNEVSGQDLNWFFQEFFYQAKDFDYAISSVETKLKPNEYQGEFGDLPVKTQNQAKASAGKKPVLEKEKIYQAVITLRRYGEAKPGPGFALKLKIEFEDGSTEWREWDGQSRWHRFYFEKPLKVKRAWLDPEGLWLVDTNLSNNSYSLHGPGIRILSVTANLLWLVQNVLVTCFSWL